MNLTDEQRAALEKVCYLADGYECAYAECAKDQENALSIVRSMLGQSRPVWEITEERKAALKVAVGEIDLAKNIHYLHELKGMLAEAEGKL